MCKNKISIIKTEIRKLKNELLKYKNISQNICVYMQICLFIIVIQNKLPFYFFFKNVKNYIYKFY